MTRMSIRSWLTVSAISLAALGLAACDSNPKDDSAKWTPERLYTEAKEEASAGATRRRSGCTSGSRAAPPAPSSPQQRSSSAPTAVEDGRAGAGPGDDRTLSQLHPTSPAYDYALYLQGLINFNDSLGFLGSLTSQDLSERDQQASRDSYQSFRQLIERFPQSSYADDARLRMNYIVNSLAAYEVHVARYYFRRGAYVAAANRAQQAVQGFQQSPAVEEALYIMAQSYDRLGLTQLRDDADRVLKTSFPNSTIYANGLGNLQRSWWQLW